MMIEEIAPEEFSHLKTVRALDLPLKELWRKLNQEGTSVIAEKYYPSINNYCSVCKEDIPPAQESTFFRVINI